MYTIYTSRIPSTIQYYLWDHSQERSKAGHQDSAKVEKPIQNAKAQYTTLTGYKKKEKNRLPKKFLMLENINLILFYNVRYD